MAQHWPSSSSREVCPKDERPNGFPESKMSSQTVSRQLIMIFGDHDQDDRDNTTNTNLFSRTIYMKRNKKSGASAADLGYGFVDVFGGTKITKKRRYRTIQSLYMVTKPIH